MAEILISESMLVWQMMSMGNGVMPPMMHAGNMQQFMPHMAMGMMDMHRPPFIPFASTPFPRPPHMVGLGTSYPAPRYPFDPSRAHLRSPHPNPVSNQPQFPAYMNPYSQFAGLHRMQQAPPPLQVIISQNPLSLILCCYNYKWRCSQDLFFEIVLIESNNITAEFHQPCK